MDLAMYEAETAFADLICVDPEWLRDEFDSLVSASFGQPPVPPPPAPPQVPPDDGDQRPALPPVARSGCYHHPRAKGDDDIETATAGPGDD